MLILLKVYLLYQSLVKEKDNQRELKMISDQILFWEYLSLSYCR
jgi:hypothetical protein